MKRLLDVVVVWLLVYNSEVTYLSTFNVYIYIYIYIDSPVGRVFNELVIKWRTL